MSDTKLRAPRATEVLKSDHERVKVLFSEYEEFGDDSALTKQGIYEQILRELAVHARIEEDLFYPAVAELGETEGASDQVDRALEEHQIVKALLAELSMLAPNSEEFDASMQALKESVMLHAQEEEEKLLPLFEKLTKEKRDQVSEALSRERSELTEGTAGLE